MKQLVFPGPLCLAATVSQSLYQVWLGNVTVAGPDVAKLKPAAASPAYIK